MENRTISQLWYIPAVMKALTKSEGLLGRMPNDLNCEDIHAVKSTLYAAIEQVGTRVERLTSLQRMLRELFVIVTANLELKDYEREVGHQLISEIKERYGGVMKIDSEQSITRAAS